MDSELSPCVGSVTVNGTWFEDAPSLLRTCNCATAGCANALPLIFAARVVELTYVVGTAVPFTIRAACDWKFAPCTVTVTFAVPAVTTCGETWLIDGLTIAITVTPDPQPEHRRLTISPNAATLAKNFNPIPSPDTCPRASPDAGTTVGRKVVGSVHRTKRGDSSRRGGTGLAYRSSATATSRRLPCIDFGVAFRSVTRRLADFRKSTTENIRYIGSFRVDTTSPPRTTALPLRATRTKLGPHLC